MLASSPLPASDDLRLIDAARNGDGRSVSNMIEQSVDVNALEADGTTALQWAAHHDDLDMANQLLAAGANADLANEYGVAPLHLACTNRSDAMVRVLLSAGADANAALWNGESALMRCARTGAATAVEALLAGGADPNSRESRKHQTALMWAAAEGHGDVTGILVKNGADIAARSVGNYTPLLYAARSGDLESALALLDAGADPNETAPEHGNTLLVAAASGHEPLSLLLLKSGADADVEDAYGITALHYSVANGLAALNGVRYDPVYRRLPDNMHGLAEALLEAGADPNVQIARSHRLGPDGSPFDMVGATPFLLAAISADTELMQLFKAHGANQNIVAKGGTTSLMAAARAACTGACAFKGGNKANDQDIERAYQAVKAVVAMGIDLNAKNEDGQTAMHMAAFTGADPVVRYLADNGADINVKDNYGETPWSMASGISPVLRYRGLYGYHQTTAALLEQLGATTTSRDAMDPNAPPPPGQ
ncbi:MAG: ankyrin repeat domain-containing protein [Woeseiaceae bacterium]|jgi:ankyrin repeat protein